MTTWQLSSIGQKSLLLILSLYPLTHTSVTLFPSLSACLSFSAPVSQLFKQTLSLSLPLSHINNVTKCISVFKPWQGPSVTFLFNNKHKKRGTEWRGQRVCATQEWEWYASGVHYSSTYLLVGSHSSFCFHQCANSPISLDHNGPTECSPALHTCPRSGL